MAAAASGHGPSGFSFALILTASGGIVPRIAESCARAGSLKNVSAAPPADIMAAMRPKFRREKPRFKKSRLCCVFNLAYIHSSIWKSDFCLGGMGYSASPPFEYLSALQRQL